MTATKFTGGQKLQCLLSNGFQVTGQSQNVSQLMQTAVAHHVAGRCEAAEIIYRQVLSAYPRHPDALHLLGVLAGQMGHLDAGIQLIQNAVDVKPDFADAFGNLGRLLADRGQIVQAGAAYRRMTELQPSNANAWFGLGLALVEQKKPDDAVQAFEAALRANPRMAEAQSELGSILKGKGQLDAAIATYRRALALNPRLADTHNNLANALLSKQQIEEALASYQAAIELRPDKAVFHANMGDALCRLERFAPALDCFNKALVIDSQNLQALNGAGAALCGLRRSQEALALHERALAIKPGDPSSLRAKAEALLDQHAMAEAAAAFELALEADAQSESAWAGLGIVHRSLGRFEKAAACFNKALEINPDNAGAYKNLASVTKEADNFAIERLAQTLSKTDLSEEDRIAAHFGIAKRLDDAERFDEAFEHYSQGNLLHRTRRGVRGDRFDREKLRALVDATITTFTPSYFAERAQWGEASELPVFVVGMPRSGTTLVEQIAASHSAIFGAGELSEIGQLQAVLNYPDGAADWTRDKIADHSLKHLETLRRLGGNARLVIDKNPSNILYLGLIATLFPNARVIFCQRDPLDNCLSCYFQWFTRNSQMFSYDLNDCGTQYLEQERLKAHWERVLPLKMITVQYEEMVADLEGQSRRLIDFLGLEWESACLDFYNTERTVLTASVWQVRQPIYTRSVGRWKHYEKHLGPLLAALGK